jgi:hypothetical protein
MDGTVCVHAEYIERKMSTTRYRLFHTDWYVLRAEVTAQCSNAVLIRFSNTVVASYRVK